MNKVNRDKNLKKTVFITGATSGIGRAITLRFANKGWNIICHYYSNEVEAQELKKIIANLRSIADNLKEFQIDSIVNNAGTYMVSKHFSELTIDDISKTFMVNVFAPIVLTSSIFLSMKERRFGRIVNISSIAGLHPYIWTKYVRVTDRITLTPYWEKGACHETKKIHKRV